MLKALRVLLHLVIFAAAGELAYLLLLWVLQGLGDLRQLALGPLSYPYTLLLGFAVGAVCWVGFELGRARWYRVFAGGRRADDNLLRPVLSGMLVLYFVLGAGLSGAALALGNAKLLDSTTVFDAGCVPLLAVFPLVAGVLAGARREPSVYVAGFFPPMLGALGGFLFGVSASIVWAVFYTPPPCSGRVCFQLPVYFGVILVLFICTAAGLGMGYLSGVSAGVGVLLCRLLDPALQNAWRLPTEAAPSHDARAGAPAGGPVVPLLHADGAERHGEAPQEEA